MGVVACWLACQLVLGAGASVDAGERASADVPTFPALLPEDQPPPFPSESRADVPAEQPAPRTEEAFPTAPILPDAPPPPASTWERVDPVPAPSSKTATRAPRPRPARFVPEPLWKSVSLASLGGLLVLGGAQATAGMFTMAFTLAFMAVMIPAALEASPLVCLAGMCGMLPAQGLLFGVLAFAAPVVAAPLVGQLVRRVGKRNVDEVPLYVAALVPGVLAWLAAGAVQFLGAFGNCCLLWISLGAVMDWLQTSQGWPQQNAEYWVMRRVSPVVFFACLGATQVASLVALAGGSVMATGLMSLAVFWLAEPVRPPRRIRPRAESSTSAPVTVAALRTEAEPLE